jgi:hypothetical protein
VIAQASAFRYFSRSARVQPEADARPVDRPVHTSTGDGESFHCGIARRASPGSGRGYVLRAVVTFG